MTRTIRALAAALLLSTAGVSVAQTEAPAPAATTATMTVHADTPEPTYDRRLFTRFAEHALGS